MAPVRTGALSVDAALGAGYSDQPHMHRAIRRFAGVTPRQLLDRQYLRSTAGAS